MGAWLGLWRSDAWPFLVQAVPFAIAAQADAENFWLPAFGLAVVINFWAWLLAMFRRRTMEDTPTSRIASAAQGYVELSGTAGALPEGQMASPLTQLPCLWYRFTVETRSDRGWKQTERGESERPFLLDDGSGHCEIDPRGAEIHTAHKETRTDGNRRVTEWILLRGDRLYALGDFRSNNGAQVAFDRRRDVGDLLAVWKADQADLHHRFDLDRNGAIDDQEWDSARQAAESEVEEQYRRIRAQPTRHYLGKPRRGRPFLISNRPPETLGRRYRWLSGIHLALLVAALAGVGWALRLPA